MAGKHSHDSDVDCLKGQFHTTTAHIANIVWLQIVRVDLAEPRRDNIVS